METFLTPTILEQPHTARDYLQWVRYLIAQVKAEPDGIGRIRLRTGLAKELMQEAFPIGLFASRYFENSADVEIALKVGSQTYDAVVRDQRTAPSGIAFLEVTLATEGEVDYLRMVKLHKTGQVSGLGRVTRRGTKNTGRVIHVENEAVSQQEVLQRERKVIADAIGRKLGKAYLSNTALIIAFDDTMSFDRSDNIENISNVLREYRDRLTDFHTVAVVGLMGSLLLCQTSADAT